MRAPSITAVAATSILSLSIGLTLASHSAIAAFVGVPENGIPGHLSLAADPYPTTIEPAFMSLAPGETQHWQISAHLVDPSSPLTMQLKRDGELITHPGGLTITVQTCEQEWADHPANPTCPVGATTIIPTTPLSSLATFGPLAANTDPVPPAAPTFNLGTLTSTHAKYVLVSLSLPAQADATDQSDRTLMGLHGSFGFGFTARGDDNPGTFADTGVEPAATVLTALGLLGLGTALLLRRRRGAHPRGEHNA